MTISDSDILALSASLTEAGLNGTSENAQVSGFCERANAIGIPVDRALVIIDTLLHREADRIATVRSRKRCWTQAVAAVDGRRGQLLPARRYTLRGVERPQELFTLEPAGMLET